MAGRVYGKAYPITAKDAKAYSRIDRRLRPNPIGVTTMAAVNGKGAYARSAREMAAGKTRSQRIARAEAVYRNGEKPMILKNRKKKSSAAEPKTKKRTTRAKRTKVAGTRYYKVAGGRYQNSKGKFVKASAVKRTKSTKKTTRKSPAKRRVRRNASVGYSSSYAKGYERMERSKKRASSKKTASGKTAVGKYKRTRLKDPRTGKTRLSYMYKGKGGKLKRKSGHKSPAAVKQGRKKAATKIQREGSAFVANGKRTSARRKRAGRRLAAYSAARRSGKKKSVAQRIALKKVPLKKGDKFKSASKAPVTVGKVKVRRNKSKSKTKLVANGRRKRRTTSSATGTVRRRRKRTTKASGVTRRKRRKSTTKRKTTAKRTTVRRRRRKATAAKSTRKRVRRRKAKAAATPRRRRASKRKMRRNGNTTVQNRRRMRRNGKKGGFKLFRKNSFMANLKAVLKTGLFVTTGFLAHRVITNLIVDNLLGTTMADNATFQTWKKPLTGLGVLGLGVAVSGAVAKKNAMELGAGMVASWLQSLIVAGLNAAGQPQLVASVAGYSNSKAYDLRGVRRRRRGLRGFGGERNAVSIQPRYTPVGSTWQQAAAGQFQQAAAGSTLGEYFTATQGVGEYYQATGEYFAPNGMKGVGGYEPAGQLAMQASAGVNQVIRDGVRPDGDLDRALDLAEAAAGLGEVPQIERVPQRSQWIPNGPLWAGETPVTDTQRKSEVSAGILSRSGGNGILSGG